MKLRFLARGDTLVSERNRDGSWLNIRRYVGRDANKPGAPASGPYECDAETGEAAYLARCVREGDLYAADQATATAIGVGAEQVAPSAAVAARDSRANRPSAARGADE